MENVRFIFLLISSIKVSDSIFISPFFFGYLTEKLPLDQIHCYVTILTSFLFSKYTALVLLIFKFSLPPFTTLLCIINKLSFKPPISRRGKCTAFFALHHDVNSYSTNIYITCKKCDTARHFSLLKGDQMRIG